MSAVPGHDRSAFRLEAKLDILAEHPRQMGAEPAP
jgi:hypothetical protein